jgi:ribosomal protein L40E
MFPKTLCYNCNKNYADGTVGCMKCEATEYWCRECYYKNFRPLSDMHDLTLINFTNPCKHKKEIDYCI